MEKRCCVKQHEARVLVPAMLDARISRCNFRKHRESGGFECTHPDVGNAEFRCPLLPGESSIVGIMAMAALGL